MQFPLGFGLVRVAGIYEQEDFTGGFPVDWIVVAPAYERGLRRRRPGLARLREGALGGVGAAARRASSVSCTTTSRTSTSSPAIEYRDDQERAIDRFLAVTIALLFLVRDHRGARHREHARPVGVRADARARAAARRRDVAAADPPA